MSIWCNRMNGAAFEDSMINLFVTYRCNLACPYCFAQELSADFPKDLQMADFRRLLGWMEDTGVTSAALIGGEPTLHPEIVVFAREMAVSGITVALFTNGLFWEESVPQLAGCIHNFVVNYNDPEIYTPEQSARLHRNLSHLAKVGARITFSKNFSLKYPHHEHFLLGARRYGVKAVRYDITRPSCSGRNDFSAAEDGKDLMKQIVHFVRECEGLGIKTGMDCCVKFCELDPEDRAFLERVSMKLRGICHPSIDIHPDLSASYCLPLKNVSVKDVTLFANAERLMHHFAATVRPMRFENVSAACHDCRDYKKKCQGGCMAAKTNVNNSQGTDRAI